jgi:hypothetical protein
MKTNAKLMTITLLACLLVPGNRLSAQYHVVKINALGLLSGVNLAYEYGINDLVSVGLSGHTIDYSKRNINNRDVEGWGIMPEARIYPLKNKRHCPAGLFAGTYFRYRNLTDNSPELSLVKHNGNDFNFGLCAGYKIYINHLIIEFLGGIGHKFGSWSDIEKNNNAQSGVIDDNSNGNDSPLIDNMRLEVSLGFLFPSMDKKQSDLK